MKKLLKVSFGAIILCGAIWTVLYVFQTSAHPFASREDNITRVNVALINQFNDRKKAFQSLWGASIPNQSRDTVRFVPNRIIYSELK